MMNIKKLLTVGGDERMLYTSQSLAEKGFDVEIFASSPPADFENICPTGEKSIDSASARQPRRSSSQFESLDPERAFRHSRARSDRFCGDDGRRFEVEFFQKGYPRFRLL